MLLKLRYNMGMKLKSLITLSLLLAMSFSILHSYAFAFYDDEHCNTSEYVQEFEGPNLHESSDSHNDICDIHYEYHHPYLVPSNDTVAYLHVNNLYNIPENTTYLFETYSKTIKPPIA